MEKKKILKLLNKCIKQRKKLRKPEKKPKKLIIFKYKKRLYEYIAQKLQKLLVSKFADKMFPILKFIISYGILGYSAYYSFMNPHKWYIAVFGFGAAIYLLYDGFDYVWERIKIIWMQKRSK